MNETVSCVITTKNRLELLKRAIKSVKEQTYSNIELIVVDDGSTDGTWQYCTEHGVKILKGEGKGGNHARNIGIKASKGEYMAFLDDDDYWLPTKIEKQVALIDEKHCGVVYCGMRREIVKNDGSVYYEDLLPWYENQGNLSKKIFFSIPATTSSVLVTRRLFERTGLFDEDLRFWQEYELSIRMAQYSEFHFVNEPLIIYRVDKNDSQRLTNKYYEWKDAVRYIHNKHIKLYKQLSALDRAKSRRLVINDAYCRCKAADMKLQSILYWCAFKINKIEQEFIRIFKI